MWEWIRVSLARPGLAGEIVHCAVQSQELLIVGLGNVDAEPLVQGDDDIEKVVGIDVELIAQRTVRLEAIVLALRGDAGERIEDGCV